jgi:predicted phosphate transport protein (TIGR00153 family)
MARFSLIPKDHRFFLDFVEVTKEIKAGGHLLQEMLSTDPPRWATADEIKEIEHRCDTLTHQTLHLLNKTFVTPLDREDIYAIARSLDDVMDAIDAAAGYVRLYRIEQVRTGARELARIIVQSCEELHRAMERLEHRTGVMESVVEINRLENEGDQAHSHAIAELFAQETDPIEIIKWKEILSFLEEATDRCEDVANLLESVVVKYA